MRRPQGRGGRDLEGGEVGAAALGELRRDVGRDLEERGVRGGEAALDALDRGGVAGVAEEQHLAAVLADVEGEAEHADALLGGVALDRGDLELPGGEAAALALEELDPGGVLAGGGELLQGGDDDGRDRRAGEGRGDHRQDRLVQVGVDAGEVLGGVGEAAAVEAEAAEHGAVGVVPLVGGGDRGLVGGELGEEQRVGHRLAQRRVGAGAELDEVLPDRDGPAGRGRRRDGFLARARRGRWKLEGGDEGSRPNGQGLGLHRTSPGNPSRNAARIPDIGPIRKLGALRRQGEGRRPAPPAGAARRRRACGGAAPAPRFGGVAGFGVAGKRRKICAEALMKRLLHQAPCPVWGCESGRRQGQAGLRPRLRRP